MTAKTEQKSFARPDGTRAFERGAMDIPRIGDAEIGRLTPADGAGFGARPGGVTALPQGHDAWVVGDELVVIVDWYGASGYART